MESKKTFGEYICRRRKELGLTQKEFAGRLYVTESAVSKWERGMSYPDITLIHDICAVLDISEHELLTASEDTERRASEKLAAKYLRLTQRYRITQYLLYGGGLLAFVIGGIVTAQPLGWFLIAAASLLLAASLTLAPALAAALPALEHHKWSFSLGCAALSLELLFIACWLYSGGDWLPMTMIGTLFGLTLVLLPFVLPTLPLPSPLNRCKTSLYFGIELVLLLLLVLVYDLQYGDGSFPIAAASILFGASLLLLPICLRQLPLPEALTRRRASLCLAIQTALLLLLLLVFQIQYWDGSFPTTAAGVLFGLGLFTLPIYLRQLPLPVPLNRCKTSLYLCIETALLLALLLFSDLRYGDGWFPVAALGVLLGLGLFILPVCLRQFPLPQPLNRHKALLYCAAESLLLLLLVTASGWESPFLGFDLLLTLLGLTLPWGLLALLRYLPVNRWLRAGLSLGWSCLWVWLYPWCADRLVLALYGQEWNLDYYNVYQLTAPFGCDFTRWATHQGSNIAALALIGFAVLSLLLTAIGLRQRKNRLD